MQSLGDDAEGLDGLPAAAGEVGALDGHAAFLHGAGGDLKDRRPVGRVIHGHVRRDTLAQAVEHAVVHYEIHASVAANLLAKFTNLTEQRVLVGLHELGEFLLLVRPFVAVILYLGVKDRVLVVRIDREAGGVAEERGLGAAEGVDARVGTRAHDVMLDHDGAAELRLNDRRVHVAANVLFVLVLTFVRLVLVAELG